MHLSTLSKDYISSYLRYQLSNLETVLKNIEGEAEIDNAYVDESLKRVEVNLRQLRKFIDN